MRCRAPASMWSAAGARTACGCVLTGVCGDVGVRQEDLVPGGTARQYLMARKDSATSNHSGHSITQ
eukprot:1860489-Rhodomonas_salina.1